MARRKKKEELRIGALGEDIKTNEPVYGMPEEKPVEVVPAALPKIKEQPKEWPFNKSNVINERKELERIARRVNMKYDNPGAKKIIKIVTYDIENKEILCKDYKIEY